MRIGPYLLFPLTVDKRGVLDGLPSQEPAHSFKRISRDISKDTPSLDIRVVTDKWGNFSISTSCTQQKTGQKPLVESV